MSSDRRKTQLNRSKSLPDLIERRRGSGRRSKLFKGLGLPAKLLLLTALFVMIAEVLIFVPSVSNFRVNWLKERLAAAQIASLAAEVTPTHQLPRELKEELLENARVHALAVRRNDQRLLILQEDMPKTIDGHYDLRRESMWELIRDALGVLFDPTDRTIRVVGNPDFGAGNFVEIVIQQGPLRKAMLRFGLNVLGLSIIISIIAATLVYLSLNALLVRPMMRLTHNMVHFSRDPEDATRIIEPSERKDEIGVAERELRDMQLQLAGTLQQKNHLAALGLAVNKINHDLRNMLASAQLISDRLGTIEDATVQRFTPKLIHSLDRAIRLCADTLRFGSIKEPSPERSAFALEPLVREVGDSLGLPKPGRIDFEVNVDGDLELFADRDQLYRVLANLCRNALQILESLGDGRDDHRISIVATGGGGDVVITVSDTGPGLVDKAKENLFKAFQGSARKGGSGLGLVISLELVRAHGGIIEYVDSGKGATFRITLPDQPAGAGRRAVAVKK